MMENHRAPYMGGCTAIVVLLFMLLLKMDSTYPMFLLSRRSKVRFIRIRISSMVRVPKMRHARFLKD